VALLGAAPAQARLVVRFKTTADAASERAALESAGAAASVPGPGGARVVELRRHVRHAVALHRLRASRAVAWAAPEYRARIAQATHNDTGVAARTGTPGGWATAQWDFDGDYGINAPGAWEMAQRLGDPGGRGVTVAVLDTGVAYAARGKYRRTPELPERRIVRGYDFVDHDPYPNDANGHGTFIASTIAAEADNGYGMVGVAYNANIMPVRVLDADGGGFSSPIADGIRYAARKGAQVINVSIELFTEKGNPMSITAAPDIRSALRYARAKGAIVVSATGNSASPKVPTLKAQDLLIQVGGTTERGCVAEYSNYGPGLDIMAPGGGQDADVPGDARCDPNAASTRTISQVTFRESAPEHFLVPDDYEGTSMAAPHVTGVVALMLGAKVLGAKPTPSAVASRLEQTARDLGAPGPDRYYGWGLIDAAAAMQPPATPA
jgi:serine protease